MGLLNAFADPQFRKDVARGLLDAGNRGAVAGLLGGPVDLATMALRPFGYNVEQPVGGSEWIGQKMQNLGLVSEKRNPLAEGLAAFAGPMAAQQIAPKVFAAELRAMENMAKPSPMNAATRGQAGVVGVDLAKKLNTKLQIPDDELFRQAVSNTPGAQISDDGLRMMVQRNQNPDQSLSPSVRGGVFYLPEGATQGKYYSTGKSGYGGTERISGETLVQNPLFVKGATGGKAPQAAIDQIMGKGAYEAIRSDALKTMGYNLPHTEKVAKVKTFLDRHAPELSDYADYIVSNSKSGNQLPYALQEAAVGSAVRNAGHDAVLGYSKGKAGPFLSELFDVRESHYPNRFGDTELWEGLYK